MYIRFPCTFHAKNSIVSECPNIFPCYIGSAPSGERFTFATTVSATMRYAAHVTRRIYIQFDHLSFMAAILDECCHFADWIFSAVICFCSFQNKQQNVTEQKIKCRFLRWHGSIKKKHITEENVLKFEKKNVNTQCLKVKMYASISFWSERRQQQIVNRIRKKVYSQLSHWTTYSVVFYILYKYKIRGR